MRRCFPWRIEASSWVTASSRRSGCVAASQSSWTSTCGACARGWPCWRSGYPGRTPRWPGRSRRRSRSTRRRPPLETGVLAGTTRDWLLAPDGAAALGLAAAEAAFGVEELLAADEAILCSSVAGILPLVEVDGRQDARDR